MSNVSPNADYVGRFPKYRKVWRLRRRFVCDLCGAPIDLRETMLHTNWHLFLDDLIVPPNGSSGAAC